MPGIFISYRREDTAEMCDRLDAALAGYFGRANVFKDKSAMVSGRDFSDQIQQAIAQSNVMLVLIGPRWLSATGPSGVQRIHEPNDYVRKEIEMARQYGVTIIPVLVNLAPMPGQAVLPASIAFLSMIDATPLRVDPDYPVDTQRIIEKILTLAPQLTPRFDPAAALAQAKSGAVPPGWRVWLPTGTSALGTAWRYFIYAAIFTIFIGFGITILSGGSGLSSPSFPAGPALGAGLVVGLLAGIIGLFVGGANSGTGYLVLTPDGIAQAIGTSNDSIDFAQVESVSSNTGMGGAYVGPVMVLSTGTQTALTFLMRDGSKRGWVIRREFGDEKSIAQALIAGHTRYVMSHASLGVPQLPAYAPAPGAIPSPAPAAASGAPSAPYPLSAPVYAPNVASAPTQTRPASRGFPIIAGVITGALAIALVFLNLVSGVEGPYILGGLGALAGFITTWRTRSFRAGLVMGLVSGIVLALYFLYIYGSQLSQASLAQGIVVTIGAGCVVAAVGGTLAKFVSWIARRG